MMSDGAARLELANPDAYKEMLTGKLGDRDPLEVLAETADTLREIVESHSTAQMRSRPFAGKWSPIEVPGLFSAMRQPAPRSSARNVALSEMVGGVAPMQMASNVDCRRPRCRRSASLKAPCGS